MMHGLRLLVAALLTFATFGAGPEAAPPTATAPKGEKSELKIDLAPHRAVYDLKLALSRGKRPIEGVRGRILYDFTGNPCEGYALQFRQVSELNTGEGATCSPICARRPGKTARRNRSASIRKTT